jgi:protein AaeX
MRLTEINLFGVYVAPMSLLMVAAWLLTIALRWIASRFGLLRYVWHPALFVFAIYMIVLSSLTLIVARSSSLLPESQQSAPSRAIVATPCDHSNRNPATPPGVACE